MCVSRVFCFVLDMRCGETGKGVKCTETVYFQCVCVCLSVCGMDTFCACLSGLFLLASLSFVGLVARDVP